VAESSALIGLSPDSWTLREIVWMHDAKARSDWNHTASLMCLFANTQGGKGKRFTVEDFHPLARRKKSPEIRISAKALKGIFGL
jgi:hypothetical protein